MVMDEYCDDDDDDDDDESDNVGGGDDQGQPRNNRLSAFCQNKLLPLYSCVQLCYQ